MHGEMKRHARLVAEPDRVLWVGDDQDWARMRTQPRPALRCPQEGCGQRLHPVENRHGTRFLRMAQGGSASCGHWTVDSRHTGPESERHLWVKARLLQICGQLGWTAVAEDPNTHADVWLPDAATAIEVQLRPTSGQRRTRQRQQRGAERVIWLLAEGVPDAHSLFEAPAVRFAVTDPTDHRTRREPWVDGAAGHLWVWGTVWRWDEWRLVPTAMSGYRFLAEVLAGERVWLRPGGAVLPRGQSGWILRSDLRRSGDGGSPYRRSISDDPAWSASHINRLLRSLADK